jgi:hypothetical protein
MQDPWRLALKERLVVDLPRSQALGAGDDQQLRPAVGHQLDVVPGQPLEVLAVAVPQQIVPAAALVGRDHRRHAELVHEPHGGPRRFQRRKLEIGEKRVVIHGAAGPVEHRAGLWLGLQVVAQPTHAVLLRPAGGHHAHHRLQRPAVRAFRLDPRAVGEFAELLDQLRVADLGRAAAVTEAAGEATEQAAILNDLAPLAQVGRQHVPPRAVRGPGARDRAGGGAFPAVVTGPRPSGLSCLRKFHHRRQLLAAVSFQLSALSRKMRPALRADRWLPMAASFSPQDSVRARGPGP